MSDFDYARFHKDLQRLMGQRHWDGAARLFATVTWSRPRVREEMLAQYPEFANPTSKSDRDSVRKLYAIEESAA